MEFHDIDVNTTQTLRSYLATTGEYMTRLQGADDDDYIPINRTLLSCAVLHCAVNCVAYLKEIGARSRDRLAGSGYDVCYALNAYYPYAKPLMVQQIFTHHMAAAEYNTLQLTTLIHGRNALITRLMRDERNEIAKSYKVGLAALRYYADSQRASLLLAKNDGRLLLILYKLATIEIPVELRQKIVDFAFFGKDAPERKANRMG